MTLEMLQAEEEYDIGDEHLGGQQGNILLELERERKEADAKKRMTETEKKPKEEEEEEAMMEMFKKASDRLQVPAPPWPTPPPQAPWRTLTLPHSLTSRLHFCPGAPEREDYDAGRAGHAPGEQRLPPIQPPLSIPESPAGLQIQRWMKEWEDDLAYRPEEVKRSMIGSQVSGLAPPALWFLSFGLPLPAVRPLQLTETLVPCRPPQCLSRPRSSSSPCTRPYAAATSTRRSAWAST